MISNGTDYHIKMAVSEECAAAIEKHGNFHSHHEAWAVLREECQEVVEGFAPFDCASDSVLDLLWDSVRLDNPPKMEGLERIRDAAERLAEECIQVMAVCMKWQKLIDKEREEVEQNNVNRPADEGPGAPVHPERPCGSELHPGS